jgi:hypothetical protein
MTPIIRSSLALVAAITVAAPVSTAQDTAQKQSTQKVIEGVVDIYSWAPPDTSVVVDASNINLRRVFEDLGPVATQWYQHVITLSNPFFEGREPGTRAMEVAADYVEFWFKQAGLEPAFPAASADGTTPSSGDWTSHRQNFTIAGGNPRVVESSFTAGSKELTEGKEFSVLAMSGTTAFDKLPVVFAGYAIESGKDGYTSFGKNDDFAGKAVVFFRHEPIDANGKSKWSDVRWSADGGVLPKVDALLKRKAAALIMVTPPGAVDAKTKLDTAEDSRWGRALGVPFVQLSGPAAERLLKAGDPEGKSLIDWRRLADDDKINTLALGAAATVSGDVEVNSGRISTQNVGGVLRGKGALADQWIVAGAHYDHVGYGYFGSPNPGNRGKLHPGADDNASGTAALLVLAQQMSDLYASKDGPKDARSVLFLAFSSEERNLNGSRYFVEHPTVAADKISVMLNMDMVGRLRSDDLNVGGMGSAEDFVNVLRPSFERSGLTIHADPTGRSPSDHASFYTANIPVVFLYTGNHDEYHAPEDKGYTVNPGGASKVVALAKDIASTIATRKEQLVFRDGTRDAAPDRGYGPVRLGIQPGAFEEGDEASEGKQVGVLVAGVSEGTSAADAGIKPGDVLLSWNGKDMPNGRVMVERLNEHKPGDVVKLVVLRDGKEITIDVKLKASSGRRRQ